MQAEGSPGDQSQGWKLQLEQGSGRSVSVLSLSLVLQKFSQPLVLLQGDLLSVGENSMCSWEKVTSGSSFATILD